MKARGITRLIMGALVAALAVSGCALDESAYPDNTPPITYLAVLGDSLNTVGYRTVLHWWGADADGSVTGYVYRWSAPWEPEEGDSLWWEDPGWVFTTAMTDTFDVPIGGEYAERVFSVRAIDDDRAADPEGLSQLFRLHNEVPSVAWSDVTRHPTLARPSLPAVSFAWTPQDFDGNKTIAYARLWLDTIAGEDSAASAITAVGDTIAAFSAENFNGRYGTRTVYCQLWDRAATPSNIISWTWNVVAPGGEYLLLDNAGEPTPGPQQTDDLFWRARLDNVIPGNYHIYDVWRDGPFRSAQEVLPVLRLFKGIVWYGGKQFDGSAPSDEQMRTGLGLAQDALGEYVAQGGRLLLTGHNVIGTASGLDAEFYLRTFGIERVYDHFEDDVWISDLTLPRRTSSGSDVYVHCGPSCGGVDSLRVASPITMTDVFALSPALEPIMWLEPATLDTLMLPEHATEPAYLAAESSWGTGRMILASTVLTRFRDGGAGTPETAVDNLLRRLFDLQ